MNCTKFKVLTVAEGSNLQECCALSFGKQLPALERIVGPSSVKVQQSHKRDQAPGLLSPEDESITNVRNVSSISLSTRHCISEDLNLPSFNFTEI